jgi:cell division protein FtsQ
MRKKKKILRVLFSFIFLIGGLAVVMMFSPLLLLSDIGVDDVSHYTEEEIIRSSGIKKGENALKYLGGSITHLLQLRMGNAEKMVESLPWIKTAEIRYTFPGSIKVMLMERHAIAWIRHMGNFLLIDEEGYVMEVSSKMDDQYPEIRGIQPDRFTIGKKIGTEIPDKITWLVQLLQGLEQVDLNTQWKLIEVLDWIDFLEKKELYLSLDGRITAKIKLDNELTYRLSYLKELYYNYIKPEEKGIIDFFDEKYARFIAE